MHFPFWDPDLICVSESMPNLLQNLSLVQLNCECLAKLLKWENIRLQDMYVFPGLNMISFLSSID